MSVELLEKYIEPGAMVIDNYLSTETKSPITSIALRVGKLGGAGFCNWEWILEL